MRLDRSWLSAWLLLLAAPAWAASLGVPSGAVTLGRPLNLSVAATVDQEDATQSPCIVADVFHGEAHVAPARVRTTWEPRGPSEGTVRIHADMPVEEPFVTVQLRVGCGASVVRRYVLLADFPAPAQPAAPVVAAAPPLVAPTVGNPALAAATSPATSAGDAAGQANGTSSPPGLPSAAAVPSTSPATALAAQATQRPVAASAATERAVARSASARPAAPSAATVRPRVTASTAAAPRRTASPDSAAPRRQAAARPARTPAPTAAAPAPGPRLRLDPVDLGEPPPAAASGSPGRLTSSFGALAAQPASLWSGVGAPPPAASVERVQALERELGSLTAMARANASALQAIQAQLEAARSERDRLALAAVGLAILAAAALAWIGWARRPVEHGPWWRAGAHAAAAPQGGKRPDQEAVAPAARAAAEEPVAAPSDLETRASQSGAWRAVGTEELLDVRQQAEFFRAVGQNAKAIELLENHIRQHPGAQALAWLDLLDIYSRFPRQKDYERTRRAFTEAFGVEVPAMAAFQAGGRERVLQALMRTGEAPAPGPAEAPVAPAVAPAPPAKLPAGVPAVAAAAVASPWVPPEPVSEIALDFDLGDDPAPTPAPGPAPEFIDFDLKLPGSN